MYEPRHIGLELVGMMQLVVEFPSGVLFSHLIAPLLDFLLDLRFLDLQESLKVQGACTTTIEIRSASQHCDVPATFQPRHVCSQL